MLGLLEVEVLLEIIEGLLTGLLEVIEGLLAGLLEVVESLLGTLVAPKGLLLTARLSECVLLAVLTVIVLVAFSRYRRRRHINSFSGRLETKFVSAVLDSFQIAECVYVAVFSDDLPGLVAGFDFE